jgi:MGT family glycosyltransferase
VSGRSPVSRPLRIAIGAFGATGHVFPALALARRLRAAGHDVLFESLERWRGVVEELGVRFRAAPEYVAFPGPWPGKPDRPTLPEVVEELAGALRAESPDVVVNDFFTLPPILAAELLDLPRATIVPHVYPAADPWLPRFLLGYRAPRTPVGSLFWRLAKPWTDRRPVRERDELNAARAELGLPPLSRFYAGLSEQLVLVSTYPQLEYPRRWPAHVHVTGPMLFELPHRPVELPPGDAPLVVIAGSTAQDQELELVRVAAEAMADEELRVLAVLNQQGRAWPHPVPPNTRVVDWAGYRQVMPLASAVVSNGGHGTIVRALSDGVPLLVCPSEGDMAENAARVAWAGVGLRLARRRLARAPLRSRVRRLISDRRFSDRARAVAEWGRHHGGAGRAAELVEELAR